MRILAISAVLGNLIPVNLNHEDYQVEYPCNHEADVRQAFENYVSHAKGLWRVDMEEI